MRNTARQTRDTRTVTAGFQNEATYCQRHFAYPLPLHRVECALLDTLR